MQLESLCIHKLSKSWSMCSLLKPQCAAAFSFETSHAHHSASWVELGLSLWTVIECIVWNKMLCLSVDHVHYSYYYHCIKYISCISRVCNLVLCSLGLMDSIIVIVSLPQSVLALFRSSVSISVCPCLIYFWLVHSRNTGGEPELIVDAFRATTHIQWNLLLWTLENKDTSIIRTVGCGPIAILLCINEPLK